MRLFNYIIPFLAPLTLLTLFLKSYFSVDKIDRIQVCVFYSTLFIFSIWIEVMFLNKKNQF